MNIKIIIKFSINNYELIISLLMIKQCSNKFLVPRLRPFPSKRALHPTLSPLFWPYDTVLQGGPQKRLQWPFCPAYPWLYELPSNRLYIHFYKGWLKTNMIHPERNSQHLVNANNVKYFSFCNTNVNITKKRKRWVLKHGTASNAKKDRYTPNFWTGNRISEPR